MGCSVEIICHTCRTQCFLGYGSYASWAWPDRDVERFTANWEKTSPENQRLAKNLNVKWATDKHKGHDFYATTEDALDYDGKDAKYRAEYTIERPPHRS